MYTLVQEPYFKIEEKKKKGPYTPQACLFAFLDPQGGSALVDELNGAVLLLFSRYLRLLNLYMTNTWDNFRLGLILLKKSLQQQAEGNFHYQFTTRMTDHFGRPVLYENPFSFGILIISSMTIFILCVPPDRPSIFLFCDSINESMFLHFIYIETNMHLAIIFVAFEVPMFDLYNLQ
ncbi:hypothetical protein ACJX0J_027895, partial [Zea mays]